MYEMLNFPDGISYEYMWFDVINNVENVFNGMRFMGTGVNMTTGDWGGVTGSPLLFALPKEYPSPTIYKSILYIDKPITIKNLTQLFDSTSNTYYTRYLYGFNNITFEPASSDASSMFSYMFDSDLRVSGSDIKNMPYAEFIGNQATKYLNFDTSTITDASYMFQGYKGASFPQLSWESVTRIDQMFYPASNMVRLPNFNFKKLTSFGGSYFSSWLYGCTRLESIGVIDCDSITNISYALGGASNSNLKYLGGFRNLGKASSVSGTNGSYFLQYAPNLTYESIINVLNGLYDRASAGLSVLTLKLHANHMAMLSDEDKAIATNKGWTLS